MYRMLVARFFGDFAMEHPRKFQMFRLQTMTPGAFAGHLTPTAETT
jgi:hypothetical protein